MTQLLVLREHILKFYQKYALFLNPLFRFFIGFIVFSSINQMIGYSPALNKLTVEVFLAFAAILMPGSILLFFASVFTVAHIFYVSNLLALVVAIILLIIYFIYIKFVPKHAYVIFAVPIAFSLNLVYGIPIALGLFMTPAAIVPLLCGVGVYYLLQAVTSVVSTSADTSTNLYHALQQQFFECREMYALMAVSFVVLLVVYILRTRKWDYAFDIAIFSGAFCNTILLLIVNYVLNMDIDMVPFFGGIIMSTVLVWVVQFMRLALNYASVEHLQFEDEEYYYYVKAVPKMNVAAPSKRVKRINVRHFSEQMQGAGPEKEEEKK